MAELERQEAARIAAAKIEAEAKLLAEKEEEKKRIAEREAALAELAYKKSLEELTNADSKKQEPALSPTIKQIDSFKIEDISDEVKETEKTLETEVQVSIHLPIKDTISTFYNFTVLVSLSVPKCFC